MRILLIEDDTSLGSSLRSWLRMDGHAVDWLQRDEQAATALAMHDYHCVLLDRGLPGTGRITVEIDDEDFPPGQTVSAEQRVELEGEFDKGLHKTEFEVDRITLLR